MLSARDNINDFLEIEELLLEIHPLINFTSEWMRSTCENIDNHIRNK